MADTDEASSAAAREAEQATQSVQRDVEALQRVIEELAYRDDMRRLEAFAVCSADTVRWTLRSFLLPSRTLTSRRNGCPSVLRVRRPMPFGSHS